MDTKLKNRHKLAIVLIVAALAVVSIIMVENYGKFYRAMEERQELEQDYYQDKEELIKEMLMSSYEFIQDYPQIAYQWRKRGYIIQVNKGSILGRFGRNALRCAQQMLSHNLVSVMASDAHSPFRRTPYLQDAYEVVCEQYSKKIADLLFQHNPARICKNQPILRLEPIPFDDYEV